MCCLCVKLTEPGTQPARPAPVAGHTPHGRHHSFRMCTIRLRKGTALCLGLTETALAREQEQTLGRGRTVSKGTKSETSGYLLDNSSVGLEYVVCVKGPQDDKLRKSQSKVLAAWWLRREPSAEGAPHHAGLLRAAHTADEHTLLQQQPQKMARSHP